MGVGLYGLKMVDIKEIEKQGWLKSWSGEFSLLACSFIGEFYFRPSVELVGEGIHNVLFIHKNGITTCYLGKSELTKFGEFLAEKAVRDNSFLERLAKRLNEETDKVLLLIKKPVVSFLEVENYLVFEKGCETYQPFQVSVKNVPNYLSPELVEKYTPVLEEARKHSETFYDEVEDFLRELARLIGDKEKRDPKLILSLFKDEMVTYLRTGGLPVEVTLKKRYELSGLLFREGKRELIGEEVKELEVGIAKVSGLVMGRVEGKTAYPGIVKGVCRIILDPSEMKWFNRGDILVTGMTRPVFVPLMEKAAAIVTDAGGLLCHAAIVSREMKKPCVVGTETATKSFKDGDLVEVDAGRGVVRKVE